MALFEIVLDPARPGYGANLSIHVRKGDAAYGQLVHTSIFLGKPHNMGDSDIIVNGGVIQRYFKFSLDAKCSHFASLDLHVIVIRNMWKFVVKQTKPKLQCRPVNPLEECVSHKQIDFIKSLKEVSNDITRDECILGVFNQDRHNGIFYL